MVSAVVGKKDDPTYEQIRGHIPKRLARQFKQFCLDQDLDYSEGLETILVAFFTAQGNAQVSDDSNANPK